MRKETIILFILILLSICNGIIYDLGEADTKIYNIVDTLIPSYAYLDWWYYAAINDINNDGIKDLFYGFVRLYPEYCRNILFFWASHIGRVLLAKIIEIC